MKCFIFSQSLYIQRLIKEIRIIIENDVLIHKRGMSIKGVIQMSNTLDAFVVQNYVADVTM